MFESRHAPGAHLHGTAWRDYNAGATDEADLSGPWCPRQGFQPQPCATAGNSENWERRERPVRESAWKTTDARNAGASWTDQLPAKQSFAPWDSSAVSAWGGRAQRCSQTVGQQYHQGGWDHILASEGYEGPNCQASSEQSRASGSQQSESQSSLRQQTPVDPFPSHQQAARSKQATVAGDNKGWDAKSKWSNASSQSRWKDRRDNVGGKGSWVQLLAEIESQRPGLPERAAWVPQMGSAWEQAASPSQWPGSWDEMAAELEHTRQQAAAVPLSRVLPPSCEPQRRTESALRAAQPALFLPAGKRCDARGEPGWAEPRQAAFQEIVGVEPPHRFGEVSLKGTQPSPKRGRRNRRSRRKRKEERLPPGVLASIQQVQRPEYLWAPSTATITNRRPLAAAVAEMPWVTTQQSIEKSMQEATAQGQEVARSGSPAWQGVPAWGNDWSLPQEEALGELNVYMEKDYWSDESITGGEFGRSVFMVEKPKHPPWQPEKIEIA